MRSSALLLIVLVLSGPAASAALLPPLEPAPVLHVATDHTGYRAQMDAAINYSFRYRQANGGVYEYEFLERETQATRALIAYARAVRFDPRDDRLGALIRFWVNEQNPDGSWGSGNAVPIDTANVLGGLLEAGYDPRSMVLQRALLYVNLTQNGDGSWSDGVSNGAATMTAYNARNLLQAGVPRDDVWVEEAIRFLLTLQDPVTGGFLPGEGRFPTPSATAAALVGLDHWLLAPETGRETLDALAVQAAVDRSLQYLNATFNRNNGLWQFSLGANSEMVGRIAHYHRVRGLPAPDWLVQAADTLVAHQNARGAITNSQGTPLLTWTLATAASLAEMPRPFEGRDTLRVQATLNRDGAYRDGPVTLTLLDAAGATKATAAGSLGLTGIEWRGLRPGAYLLRVETPGAAPVTVPVHRLGDGL
ncbi:MAG TPA: prenyltransferase/squalene oxidase repeat-containing protein [Candidatus Thermoplasmatota archaeon]|nr:prenyltransferase/squalene oxidase repeat-containing protein [Candidatus Thermoplasmatota archaeon]